MPPGRPDALHGCPVRTGDEYGAQPPAGREPESPVPERSVPQGDSPKASVRGQRRTPTRSARRGCCEAGGVHKHRKVAATPVSDHRHGLDAPCELDRRSSVRCRSAAGCGPGSHDVDGDRRVHERSLVPSDRQASQQWAWRFVPGRELEEAFDSDCVPPIRSCRRRFVGAHARGHSS